MVRKLNFTIPEMRLAVPFVVELYIKMSRFTNLIERSRNFISYSSIEYYVCCNSCRPNKHFILFFRGENGKNEKLGYQPIGSRKFTKSIAATGTIARQGVVVFI